MPKNLNFSALSGWAVQKTVAARRGIEPLFPP